MKFKSIPLFTEKHSRPAYFFLVAELLFALLPFLLLIWYIHKRAIFFWLIRVFLYKTVICLIFWALYSTYISNLGCYFMIFLSIDNFFRRSSSSCQIPKLNLLVYTMAVKWPVCVTDMFSFVTLSLFLKIKNFLFFI